MKNTYLRNSFHYRHCVSSEALGNVEEDKLTVMELQGSLAAGKVVTAVQTIPSTWDCFLPTGSRVTELL